MNIDALTKVASRLGETAFDPTVWPNLLQEMAEHVGALGAMVLQAGVPTDDVPWSPSLGRMREIYYDERWNARDVRAIRSVAAVRRGLNVLTDEDLVSRDEVDRAPYYTSFLASQRLTAFAAVVFRSSPLDICGLVLQRTASQGAFDQRDKQALAYLEPALTASAELTRMLARTSLRASLNLLDSLSRPALALGPAGVVLGINASASAILDDDVRLRGGALVMSDERASAEIQKACEQARKPFGTAIRKREPIIVRRRGRLPLILRLLPLDGPAGSFVLGARLLITIADPGAGSPLPSGLLCNIFGLTKAEARIASHLADGLSLHQAADISGITFETARSQIKAVYSKTGTKRQAALVTLMARLS